LKKETRRRKKQKKRKRKRKRGREEKALPGSMGNLTPSRLGCDKVHVIKCSNSILRPEIAVWRVSQVAVRNYYDCFCSSYEMTSSP
jgi:hypothetical protein